MSSSLLQPESPSRDLNALTLERGASPIPRHGTDIPMAVRLFDSMGFRDDVPTLEEVSGRIPSPVIPTPPLSMLSSSNPNSSSSSSSQSLFAMSPSHSSSSISLSSSTPPFTISTASLMNLDNQHIGIPSHEIHLFRRTSRHNRLRSRSWASISDMRELLPPQQPPQQPHLLYPGMMSTSSNAANANAAGKDSSSDSSMTPPPSPPSPGTTTTTTAAAGSANVNATTSSSLLVGSYYMLGRTIGAGSFSKVRIATDVRTGFPVAVKMLPKKVLKSSERMRKCLEAEVDILTSVRHPNIVHLTDTIDTPDDFCLVLEYVDGGELFDYIAMHRDRLVISEVRRLFRQLCSSVSYLHSQFICHRDLKIENILLTGSDPRHVKLTDFGFAARLLPAGSPLDSPVPLQTMRCGSEEYAAPEVIMSQPYDGRKTDVWAMGVILFAMLTGELPFSLEPGQRPRTMYHKIARAEYRFPEPPTVPNVSSDDGVSSTRTLMMSLEAREESLARDLVKQILVATPKNRPWIKEVLKHPFLRRYSAVA
ncbi:protein kinase, AMP-activated, alpha 2 catalytic subunit [Blyttiomyces sp. JEL0837]|nr:protein kinase, AMP-activated, alpha 2 catalytic subunit [Blyttiomyces sp. JEL0837]